MQPPSIEIQSKLLSSLSLQYSMEPQTLETANSLLADLRSISEFYRTQRCSNFMQHLEESIKAQAPLDCRLTLDCISLSHDLGNEVLAIMVSINKSLRRPQTLLATLLEEESSKKLSGMRGREEAVARAHEKLIEFAKGGVSLACPSLFLLAGAEIAARLVSAAGGLDRLSSMSIESVLALGDKKYRDRACYVERSCLFGSVPLHWRRQARNLVANKLILAARADCNPAEMEMSGTTGSRLAKEVNKVIDRWEKTLKRRSEERQKEISVARDVEKLKEMKSKVIKKRASRRGVISEAREESLAMALRGIEIADGEKKEKDSN